MQAPPTRQHLSADALFRLLRSGLAHLAAHRPGNPDLSWSDALMSAFALCSLQSPSLLAVARERTAGHGQRVYGIERGPCDTAMRERRAPVEPERLRPLCQPVGRALQRSKGLDARVFVAGHYLLALEGTGYCAANQMHCASC